MFDKPSLFKCYIWWRMERDFYFGNWLFDRTDRKLVSCGQIRKSGYSISDRNRLVLSQYGQKIIICRLKMTQRHVYYSKIITIFSKSADKTTLNFSQPDEFSLCKSVYHPFYDRN